MRSQRPAVRRGRCLFSALCALALVSACGGSASPAAISASGASTLRRDVQRIRYAASSRNALEAQAAVEALRADIARFASRRALAPSDARVLMIEAGQVAARVSIEVKPLPTPARTTPSAVSPVFSTVGNGGGPAEKHGHGGGNGQGGGDGGD